MSFEQSQGRYLRRRDAAAYLKQMWGLRCSEQTLANYATRGNGPMFQRYGRDVIYSTTNLDEYAQARMSAPMRSTSEASLVGRSTG
jgi:hypothetical protein